MLETLKKINLVEFMSRCWETDFKREGTRHVALSAFRKESTPSMYVSRKKDGHWVFCDHGSSAKGTILDAVMARDGHQDVGLAIKTAKQMAEEVGLLERACPEKSPGMKLERLFEKFCGNETGPVREYLIGRGLCARLVDDLIARKVLLLNRFEESEYCCFAVRDAKGELHGLFNRKIKGPARRKRFLIGEQHVFCSDWSQVAQASRITICEAIIDALSMQTLQGGCVLAIPGANFDPGRIPDLPDSARLVEAFDGDRSGRVAAERLEKHFPNHRVTHFDLQGAHDINALLCGRKKVKPGQKLSLENRVDIALSGKPSREQATEFGVHHSRVCDIRKDAAETLEQVWNQRRPGRQAKPGPSPEIQALQESNEEITRKMELLQMRNDWLELELKMQGDRAKAAAHKKKARRKSGK